MNKSKNAIHNQKHLTLSDRTYIEQELYQRSTFRSIASTLDKDPSTISKEIQRNRIASNPNHSRSNFSCCMNYDECTEQHVCGNAKCRYTCRKCYTTEPTFYCLYHKPWTCDCSVKPPYVCNSCTRFNTCILQKYSYIATKVSLRVNKNIQQVYQSK